jgi:hypothetical protein
MCPVEKISVSPTNGRRDSLSLGRGWGEGDRDDRKSESPTANPASFVVIQFLNFTGRYDDFYKAWRMFSILVFGDRPAIMRAS